MSVENLKQVHEQALAAAHAAATKFYNERLGGEDRYPCGFAWVTVFEKGSTKLGRALKTLGFSKAYSGGMQLWNPSGLPLQNVDAKEAGAEAYAAVITRELGIKCYAGSRLD